MIELLIFGMATWRISSMLVNEDGPHYWFQDLRKWAGIEYDLRGEIESTKDTFLSGILSCLWCCSVWVALILGLLYFISPDLTLKIATILAFSTVAIVIDTKLITR